MVVGSLAVAGGGSHGHPQVADRRAHVLELRMTSENVLSFFNGQFVGICETGDIFVVICV